MANPSESTLPLQNLRIVSEPSCRMDATSDLAYATALETKFAIPCSSTTFFSESTTSETRKGESVDKTSVEDAIVRSKVHWSELIEDCESAEEEAEVSNVKVFRSLQKHPTWGRFFLTFGDGGIHESGELDVGEKFAAGAQAELYHARVTWEDAKLHAYAQECGVMYVLKVFRKGTFLQHLQRQWPEGMFQNYEEIARRNRCGEAQATRYTCFIICGTLLPDGRFAFLLIREAEDLRSLIDRCMEARACIECGPFSRRMEWRIMSIIAKAMVELHNLNIVHRDVKASNVLCSRTHMKMGKWVRDFNVVNVEVGSEDSYDFFVADFECSIGVVGTGFFRAPEILEALKDKVLSKKPHLFSEEADVYSYGMLCYEVLTGKLPFEGHRTNDYDLVLGGSRPDLPLYVEAWAHDLLRKCWHSNPKNRPTFVEILDLLSKVGHSL